MTRMPAIPVAVCSAVLMVMEPIQAALLHAAKTFIIPECEVNQPLQLHCQLLQAIQPLLLLYVSRFLFLSSKMPPTPNNSVWRHALTVQIQPWYVSNVAEAAGVVNALDF